MFCRHVPPVCRLPLCRVVAQDTFVQFFPWLEYGLSRFKTMHAKKVSLQGAFPSGLVVTVYALVNNRATIPISVSTEARVIRHERR